MAKQEVMEAIDREWNTFKSIAETFREEDRVKPGAVGYWNVHEALLHVAAWDRETMTLVKNFEESGKKPEWLNWSEDSLDQMNEQMVAERRNLAPQLIWAHFKETHEILVRFLSACDEHVFTGDSFTGSSINGETWQHYQGHGQDLKRFEESL